MYACARASTVRMIIDTVRPFPDVAYYEWDGHAEGFVLPLKDLVGLTAFSCTQDGEFHDLTFGVAIMVNDDPDLSRLTRYVDLFYNRLRAFQKYPMFAADGTQMDFHAVCFDGTAASPMGRVDARPTADVQVSCRVTKAGAFPTP